MNNNNITKLIAAMTLCVACAPAVGAQDYTPDFLKNRAQKTPVKRFAVKLHDAIGIGNAVSMSSDMMNLQGKSSSNYLGIDLGYTFWHNRANQFEINLGVGYRTINSTPEITNLEYSYNAPATADIDEETYKRFYEISDLKQKVTASYFSLPIYFEYRNDLKSWLRIYVDLGAEIDFNINSKFSSVTGNASAYGVYPQYGDLKIEEPWLNGFGEVDFDKATTGMSSVSPAVISLLAGVGLEAKIYDPVWINVGLRYNLGFSNIFRSKYTGESSFNSENAPLTYTIRDGEYVQPLTYYAKKSSLSLFSINVGISFRF